MTRNEAYRLRAILERATASLDDKDASCGAVLFPRLKMNGNLIKAGTRICWEGRLKRANVDLWDTLENAPDTAPELWSDIEYRDGIRIIPDPISATQAFARGEQGWWGEDKYTSLMDGNVFIPPGDFAQAWESASE